MTNVLFPLPVEPIKATVSPFPILNEISFSSTLINIEESKLLEQIYELIPDRLKPLVDEAFVYAKEVFVEGKIEKNKGNIVTVFPDDNKKYLSTDLSKPIEENKEYVSNSIELLDYEFV